MPNLVPLVTCRGHRRGVWSVEFSPVDQALLTASGDKTVKMWSLPDGACLRTFEGHLGTVLRALFVTAGTQVGACCLSSHTGHEATTQDVCAQIHSRAVQVQTLTSSLSLSHTTLSSPSLTPSPSPLSHRSCPAALMAWSSSGPPALESVPTLSTSTRARSGPWSQRAHQRA
jgi:hypothetical protein